MPPMQIELRTRPQIDRGHIVRLIDPAVRILQRNKYLHALLIGNERSEPEPASPPLRKTTYPFGLPPSGGKTTGTCSRSKSRRSSGGSCIRRDATAHSCKNGPAE